MDAEELHQAFIEACEQCPQFEGFDNDQTELVNGKWVNIAQLPRKGAVAVLRYWANRDTYGGGLIHNMGYSKALPDEVQALLARVDVCFDKAIVEALKDGST